MTASGPAGGKRAVVDALRQELRRGALVLAVLAVLRQEMNGTAVRETLAAGGVEIEEGALYPMLRRLEQQGLLASEWRLDGSRNKRFYLLSSVGSTTYAALLDEWREQTAGLHALTRSDADETR